MTADNFDNIEEKFSILNLSRMTNYTIFSVFSVFVVGVDALSLFDDFFVLDLWSKSILMAA